MAETRVGLTSFVGRRAELDEIRSLLGSSRLLTLCGPGGIGKTRLAMEAVPAGTAVARLETVSSSDELASGVALAIGAPLQGRAPLDAIVEHLGEAPGLLVLDTCEHIVEACRSLVVELFERCPGLRVVATSREPLHVPGEVVRRIQPLPASEAIELLTARAGLHDPGFGGRANAADLERLVVALDGIPLAIELAAARLAILSPAEMLGRLKERFRLLRTQEQTLRATVDWSYRLLTPAEQAFLSSLAVFVGGFDLAAAEAIAGPAEGDAVELIQILVDRSLVLVDLSGPVTRYRLLDTIRDYCFEQLAHEEGGSQQRRHAEFFAARFADIRRRARDGHLRFEIWFEIDPDAGNLGAALRWASENDRALLLKLVGSCWYWFILRGRWDDQALWTLDAAATPIQGSPDWVDVLEGAATAHVFTGDAQEGLRLQGELLKLVGQAAELDERVAMMTANLGLFQWIAGDLAAARTTFEGLIGRLRDSGPKELVIHVSTSLATLDLLTGDLDGAWTQLDAAMSMAGGSVAGMMMSRTRLLRSFIASIRSDTAAAAGLLAEALVDTPWRANPEQAGQLLAAATALALALGNPVRAATLLGAHARVRAQFHRGPVTVFALADYVRPMVLAALPRPAFDAAVAEGASLDREAAVGIVLELLSPGADRPASKPPLSAREMQVVGLVAEGLTNRQIGDRLFLAEKSVEGHLERIRGKLGFKSKAQLAAWHAARTPVR